MFTPGHMVTQLSKRAQFLHFPLLFVDAVGFFKYFYSQSLLTIPFSERTQRYLSKVIMTECTSSKYVPTTAFISLFSFTQCYQGCAYIFALISRKYRNEPFLTYLWHIYGINLRVSMITKQKNILIIFSVSFICWCISFSAFQELQNPILKGSCFSLFWSV